MVLALVLALTPPVAPPPRPACTEPALRRELLDRKEVDQAARKAFVELLSAGKPFGPEHAAVETMAAVDAANRDWLKGVVERYGWPGRTLVGTDGASAAWLLVQHADADRPFQRKCLGLLDGAVKAGEAEGKDLAYLTDRVLVGEGKKQVYGTQLTTAGGTLVPSPVEDEAGLDARRQAVGLPPMAEYLKRAAEMYSPPRDKKP